MLSESLLIDFLTTDLPLTQLAERHNLTIEQLIAWADSPETVRIFNDLQRIAARRSALIAAESSAKALTNLAQLSLSLAKRSELANANPAGPKPPSITALESSRKACAALLRLFPARPPIASLTDAGPPQRRSPSTAPSIAHDSPNGKPAAPSLQQPVSSVPNAPRGRLSAPVSDARTSAASSPVHPFTSSPAPSPDASAAHPAISRLLAAAGGISTG